MQLDMPDGKIAHAEIRIGDSTVMMSEENEAWGNKSPQTLGGSPMFLMIYVPDVDSSFKRQSPREPPRSGRSRISSMATARAP